MSLILDGTSGITNLTSINGGQLAGRRNIVYNGEMKVAQRSASETGLGAESGYFTLDRWKMGTDASAGRYTMAQVADGPAGFANCLKITTTTADTSIAAGEHLILNQSIEGQDLQQLQKGTATAKQVTLSFYVKGNANATYTCELFDRDNNRTIGQAFAVTTAWNRIELTFPGDTSDPLDDDNARSLDIQIFLHGGTTFSGGTFVNNTWADQVNNTRLAESHTSILDSTDRTFFITGVQMELGDTATPFEHRSYGTELALCQRYYEIGGHANSQQFSGDVTNANNYFATIYFNTTKRAAPTIANANANASSFGTGASTAGAQSLNSFRNHRTSNASSVGSFGDTWTATAEL